MKKYSLFDVIGPIMVGPSSSHTAGAARIGKAARDIYGKDFTAVTFYLHGSFQTTLQGHGSDRALVGGSLGFEPDDDRLVESLDIAKDQGLSYSFVNQDLGFVHPNTIKVVLHSEDEEDFYVIASSIGGGKIKIININGLEAEVTGDKPTIVAVYEDRLGIIVDILSILRANKISVGNLKVERKDQTARLVMELDTPFTQSIIDEINKMDTVRYCIGIEKF